MKGCKILNTILKKFPPIIMLAMIVQFFIFSENVFSPTPLINTSYIFLSSNTASVTTQKIIVAIFLFIVLCVPTYLSESLMLSSIYCGIIVIGTIIFKEMFFVYLTFVLSIPGMLVGAIVEIPLSILRFFFSGLSGAWIAWIFQLAAHIGLACLLSYPAEILLDSAQETTAKKTKQTQDTSDAFSRSMNSIVEGIDEVNKEQREKEKLETLKDIDYRLRNLDHKK